MNPLFLQQRERFEKEFECSCTNDVLDVVTCSAHGRDAKKYLKYLTSCQEEWVQSMGDEIEKRKKNLVVDNWEDGKPNNCNPRCHDSGKEEALSDVQDIIGWKKI